MSRSKKYFLLSLVTTIISLWTVASVDAAGCARGSLFGGKVFSDGILGRQVVSGHAREKARNVFGKLLPRNWERNK